MSPQKVIFPASPRGPRRAAILGLLALKVASASGCAPLPAEPAPAAAANRSAVASIGGRTLLRQSVRGYDRICTYGNSLVPSSEQTLRIGLAERCPSMYPTADTTFPVPPSARLVETGTAQLVRSCIYAQLRGRWTIQIPVAATCPLSAGMAQQIAVKPARPAT